MDGGVLVIMKLVQMRVDCEGNDTYEDNDEGMDVYFMTIVSENNTD